MSLVELVGVTGAAGFIGRHVVEALLSRGCAVRPIDVAAPQELISFWDSADCKFAQADVTDRVKLRAALAGCDAVIHLAGEVDLRSGWVHDARIRAVNVGGTAAIIDVCRAEKIGRLIYASSVTVTLDGVWGRADLIEKGTGQLCAYGRTKAEAERLVLDANSPELRTVAVRPHVVFGPGDGLPSKELLLDPKPAPNFGSCAVVFTVVYVKNLAALFAALPARLAAESRHDAVPTEAVAGTALRVGDAHAMFRDLRKLMISCRQEPFAAGYPMQLPFFVAYVLCVFAWLLDNLTLRCLRTGYSPIRFLVQLTPAALFFMNGADFYFRKDAYERVGMAPPFSYPEGVADDLRAYVAGATAAKHKKA